MAYEDHKAKTTTHPYKYYKALLKNHPHPASVLRQLKECFPKEFERDQRIAAQVSSRNRWDEWFSEKNKEAIRRGIVTSPDDYWLYEPGVRIDDNGHQGLLAKAKHAALWEYVGEHRDRVTDFTDWLFRLEHPENKNNMLDGKIGERHVQAARQHIRSPRLYDSDWVLLFRDDFTNTQDRLKCSSLLVNGLPIYGRPDYVYLHESSKTALILEVKTSRAELPADAWPNLRAQLWTYAHLDVVVIKAKRVILIGEVWADYGDLGYRRRKTYRWEHADTVFYKENEALFECFQEHAFLK